MPEAQLDRVDRRLLDELTADPELTNKALATRLGLAESTCAYRLRALRASGVLRGRRVDLDHRLLGFPLQAVVMVRLGSHTAAKVNAFYDAVSSTPGVLQVLHVAGVDDFHLLVAVEDAEALRDFVLRHVTVHDVVRQTETHLVFGTRPGPGVLGRLP